jgi:type IV secretion system protein TrbL
VEDVVQDGVTQMAEAFADSAAWAVKNLTTVWLKTPSPDVTGGSSPATWLSDRMGWFVLAAAFLSVLWAAYRMATSGTFDHLQDLAWSLGRLVVVAGTAAVATALALEVGDAVAAWVLDVSDVKIDVGALLSVSTSSPGVVIVLALVVILAQIVQAVLMLVKNAMVVLLVGFLPLTAGATNTPLGKAGFHKALTWLGAFLLYKPVAAIIYAVSFKMGSSDQTISGQLSGIALMLLAIFALPALMRFLVPVTAAATGGNAGALAGAAVGATVATGAVLAAGAATGGGGFAAAAPAAMQAAPSGAQLGAAPAATGATSTRDESEPAA